MENLATFFSGLSGVVLGAGIITMWLRQQLQDYASLKQKVETSLETGIASLQGRVPELEKRLVDLTRRLEVNERQVAPLNVPLLNQQIQSLSQQVLGMDTKLEVCLDRTTRLDERLASLRVYGCASHGKPHDQEDDLL